MNHPNIPQIHFIGRAGGHLFFAMEWIEGRTLESLTKEGPLPRSQALHVAVQAAEALRAAHQPESSTGTSNLQSHVDPGRQSQGSRFRDRPVGLDSGGRDRNNRFYRDGRLRLTRAGTGPFGDARSDIYSLGATLYHLLAGRPPFQGDNALAVLTDRLIKEAPALPPSADLTPGIQALVARMLAMQPEHRFPDVESLLEAIRIASPVPDPARRSKRLMAFLTDLLLVNLPLAGLFVGFWAVKGYFITTPCTTPLQAGWCSAPCSSSGSWATTS